MALSNEQLIDRLQLQVANLSTYQATLGLSNQLVDDVGTDLDAMNYMRDYSEIIEANKKTVFAIKQAVYNGDPDIPTSPFPLFPAANPPVNPPQTGVLTRDQDRARIIKASPNYTNEIGVALGLVGAQQAIDPNTVTPTIEVSAAQTGNLFSIVVSNRGTSDMWDVQIAKVGTITYSVAKSATGKSTDVIVPPDAENPVPRQFLVRVQLKKANANYGQLSNIVLVTINP